MKSIKEEDFVKLRKALAAAYREKEKTEVDELWQSRVMGHIRNLGPLYPKTGYFELFQGLVWRFAPVACALVLLLGAAVAQLDFVSDYELAKIFIEDPADFSLLALYNR
ncbi:MAG: hypothetical protein JSV50_21845 [Desulfobacteraceae bacterium]|nr:MAG: hypothetical protein JSV50_21845 [Desulfobacteraceae bacterium]